MNKNEYFLSTALLCLLISGCNSGGTTISPTESLLADASEERPNFIQQKSTFEKLQILRAEEGNTLALNRAEFSAYFGPLDGATSSDNNYLPDASLPPSATHVITSLLRNQDQLSAIERQRLTDVILPVADILEGQNKNSTSALAKRGLDVEFNVLIDQAIDLISEKSGWTLTNGILGFYVSGEEWDRNGLPLTDPETGARALALVPGEELGGDQFILYEEIITEFGGATGDCLIFSQPKDRYSSSNQFIELVSTVAHEVFHCFQNDIIFNSNEEVVQPVWVSEGMAAWVEHDLYPGLITRLDWWAQYEYWSFNLDNSAYSAMGFWSHVDNVAPNGLWQHAVEITASSMADTSSGVVNTMEIVGAGRAGYEALLPMAANRPQWGTNWQSTGVAGWQIDKNAESFSVSDGARPSTFTEGVNINHFYLVPEATGSETKVFSVTSDQNRLLYMHWENSGPDYRLDNNETQYWCFNGPCVCDDGSTPPVLTNITDVPSGERLYVASAPSYGGVGNRIVGAMLPLTDYCEDDSDSGDPSPREPVGISYGDPRFLTLDNHHYSFQGVGEFVLAQSLVDSYEVQVRLTGTSRSASYSSAVVMDVAGDYLQLDVELPRATALVNGDSVALVYDEITDLPNGGSFNYVLNGALPEVSVQWPNGSRAEIGFIGSTLAIKVFPATEYAGELQGLLGDFDGDINDEPQLPDGTSISSNGGLTLNRELLYTSFAAAYRITDASSLFTYNPGESTATFADKTFPDKLVSLDSLTPSQREAAQTTCLSNGVTQFPFLESCMLDFTITDNMDFVTAALSAEQTVVPTPADPVTVTPTLPATNDCGCTDAFNLHEMDSPPWRDSTLVLTATGLSCKLSNMSGADEMSVGLRNGRISCWVQVNSEFGTAINSPGSLTEGSACSRVIESKAREWMRNGNTIEYKPLGASERITAASESEINCGNATD